VKRTPAARKQLLDQFGADELAVARAAAHAKGDAHGNAQDLVVIVGPGQQVHAEAHALAHRVHRQGWPQATDDNLAAVRSAPAVVVAQVLAHGHPTHADADADLAFEHKDATEVLVAVDHADLAPDRFREALDQA